jgi:hypothetical protein
MVWIGSIWLRIGTSGELLWTRCWTFGFHNMLGNHLVAEQLVTSQEGLAPLVKPSPIRLQLIRIEVWKVRNSVHSWLHTFKDSLESGARWIRARGLWDCVEGSCRDWNYARKYPRLAWAGWKRPWILASDRKKLLRWYFFIYYFRQHYLYIVS